MYLVKILNADHRPVDVEVSLEIYRVYESNVWKPCWKSARYWRNFLRCSGGVLFSIFSTATLIQR